jgi:hypothetical protein
MERNVTLGFSPMIYLLPVAAHFGASSVPYPVLDIHGATFGNWQQVAQ